MMTEDAGPKRFPARRYASDGKGGIKNVRVLDAGEEKTLGGGWYDNPGKVKVPTKPATSAADSTEVLGPAPKAKKKAKKKKAPR